MSISIQGKYQHYGKEFITISTLTNHFEEAYDKYSLKARLKATKVAAISQLTLQVNHRQVEALMTE